MQIKIFWIGKTRNSAIKILLEDYLRRAQRMISLEIVEIPDLSKRRGLRGEALTAAEGTEIVKAVSGGSLLVVLDERGRQFRSVDFASWLEKAQIRGTRELSFIIGGPEGVSPLVRDRADLKLALGKMTWTHEIARLLLLEQIYRALSILRNSPYHKEARGNDR